jgi:hypothetical protein
MSDNESINLNDSPRLSPRLSPRQTVLDRDVRVKSEIPVIECSKEDLDDLLTSLDVLSQINVGDKLAWWDEKIPNIQNNGPIRSVRRWLSKTDDRITCIANIKEIIYKSINGFKFKDTEVRIKEALLKVNGGLNNLKMTYNNDKQMVSQLTIIIQNISSIISNNY